MNKPKIIAHRGASGHAPENTMAAFRLAMEQHADGIELDVMLSKDGHVVVIHDATVNRTTNGTGRVSALTLAELQTLDAGNGEHIPTLEEVLETFGDQWVINVELKNHIAPFDRLPVVVAEMVKRMGLTDSVVLSSFMPLKFARIRRHCPNVKLGLLTLPRHAKSKLWRLFQYDALHPYFEDIDADLVAAEKAHNRQISTYTVDDPDDIRRLAALGVDSIITNLPLEARAALETAE
ncbi:MAG: putative glycerophosphoryl diester phosphodiesterase 1 [Chloroflexi bacterium ADurb.Bin120]|jgi:glycerophosphoryl diester phosphodiesterase|uniref:Glycerophosphoryl diester phosphodiesterase n=1 Tax=Candidatus Brevifilum fermentans TaxID=1986204 RepID=A0A1Y6K0P6_9CHLR|nr:glycerophosphodiester phosphodiesterase family protein [Brevefilum fermentans]MDI9565562.1 glycerophosphodiester phosphodiesterase family protein [Chloroflexota bacterium]OQB87566.1 MAG: putative glycerophosphoryl diester phosphodiesterase 1 [Chloroflexi bacterium ADurb.Bin120]SMX53223.1 Glycerophosphoryl diester phosphodiesterase [Brevefilum fermentans]HOM67922.1 glycerophosphodiester phosphodiesterase family protein [Brevefilum fermentans]